MWDILEDGQGHLWFATLNGVSLFDGEVFQTMTRRDGLTHQQVRALVQDPQGHIWMATADGLTRYKPLHTPFATRLTAIRADREYPADGDMVELPPAQPYLSLAFSSTRLETRSKTVVYRYRLGGRDGAWQQTRDSRVEYFDLEPGSYRFDVQAIDRDLNRSEPATMRIFVPTPWYTSAWRLGLLGLGAVALVLV